MYHVRGSVQDPDALIRAGADTAATAVVLLPWSQSMSSAADIDDVVTAGMVDARIIAVVRQLRALNPFVQVGAAAREGSGREPMRCNATFKQGLDCPCAARPAGTFAGFASRSGRIQQSVDSQATRLKLVCRPGLAQAA